MAEYIEREAAIRALLNDSPEQVSYSREDAADCVRYMDAADVAPMRHGRWKKRRLDGWDMFVCSQCNGWAHSAAYQHQCICYCPNCGAKMDKEA